MEIFLSRLMSSLDRQERVSSSSESKTGSEGDKKGEKGVLNALLGNSSLKSAFNHDAVESSTADKQLIDAEAERMAQRALDQLRRTEQWARSSHGISSSVPAGDLYSDPDAYCYVYSGG